MPEVIEVIVDLAPVVIEIRCPADIIIPEGLIVDRAGANVRTRSGDYIAPR